jgi:hypothetical protein
LESQRASFLIGCRSSLDDCKIHINSIKKQHEGNVIAVYETNPLKNPQNIIANVSGKADFVVEVKTDRHLGIDQLKQIFESIPNVIKPIIMY